MGKITRKVEKVQENSARRGLIEELFYDFNTSRKRVYRINFMRGIFFGIGTVVGGTLVVAVAVAILGWLTDIPGGVGDFIQFIVDTVQRSQ